MSGDPAVTWTVAAIGCFWIAATVARALFMRRWARQCVVAIPDARARRTMIHGSVFLLAIVVVASVLYLAMRTPSAWLILGSACFHSIPPLATPRLLRLSSFGVHPYGESAIPWTKIDAVVWDGDRIALEIGSKRRAWPVPPDRRAEVQGFMNRVEFGAEARQREEADHARYLAETAARNSGDHR